MLQHRQNYAVKQQSFMAAVLTCTVGMILLFCVDLPKYTNGFSFSLPAEASR